MKKTYNKKLSILKLKQVKKRTGLSRSTIYNRIHEGTFPKQVKLGARSVGWLENEVEAWLSAKIAYRDSGKEVR